MNVNVNFPGLGMPATPLSTGAGQFAHLMMQSMILSQMMSLMQMLFQEVMGQGAMAPGNGNFGASPIGNGLGNFLGGSPRPSGSSGAPSTPGAPSAPSAPSGPTTDLSKVEGTDFGKKLAAQAEKTARSINTPGLCLKGVNDTMQAMGLPVQREASAYMALDNFRNNPRFREVTVSKNQLKSLPAGAVVIWDKGSGLPHGHISVALGDGREASSTVRNQLSLSTNFHVFLPK